MNAQDVTPLAGTEVLGVDGWFSGQQYASNIAKADADDLVLNF